MDEKRLIVIGLILAVVIGGAVWLFQGNLSGQRGSLSQSQNRVEYDDPFLGDEDAPVTIIEYFSYNCIHCKNFHKFTFDKIKEKYIDTGQVKFMARQLLGIPQYPLAALCAAEQGQYWQYHDLLFEKVGSIKSEDDLPVLREMAVSLGLNSEEFDKCYDQLRYQDQVISWSEEGQNLGLNDTPVFLVNDQKIEGNQPFEKFEEIIAQELNK